MANPVYLVAFEKGHYLPDRLSEPWAVEATVPAHAIAAVPGSADQPPLTAACGAPVNFVVDRAHWPPPGITRCQQCSNLLG